ETKRVTATVARRTGDGRVRAESGIWTAFASGEQDGQITPYHSHGADRPHGRRSRGAGPACGFMGRLSWHLHAEFFDLWGGMFGSGGPRATHHRVDQRQHYAPPIGQ